jgi:hypothetical protein
MPGETGAAEWGENTPMPAIDVRRWAERAAEMRREQSSGRRTQPQWSNTGMPSPEVPADKAVSRPPWCWPTPSRRRSRSRRLAGRQAFDRRRSSTGPGEMRSRAQLCPMRLTARPQTQRCHEAPIASRPPTQTPARCYRGSVRTTAETGSPARKARAASQA